MRSEVLRARCERRYQRKAPLLFSVDSCWLWLLGKTPGEADLRQSPWQRRVLCGSRPVRSVRILTVNDSESRKTRKGQKEDKMARKSGV